MIAAVSSANAVSSRKASFTQLEAEKSMILSLIESGSERVSFTISTVGRAPVWTFFRKVLLDSQVTPFVVCQVCGRLLKYTSRDGTKSMKLHMTKCNAAAQSNISQQIDENTVGQSDGRNSCLSIKQEDNTMDLSLSHSPSAALTAFTPSLSNDSYLSASMNENSNFSGNNAAAMASNPVAALETVAKALTSALLIFDSDVNDVNSEIASLENKLITLNARRSELLRRKETVRRAAVAVCSQFGVALPELAGGAPSIDSVEAEDNDPDYNVVPRKSRRKQPSSVVRHFSSCSNNNINNDNSNNNENAEEETS